jgi:hypothetical protein
MKKNKISKLFMGLSLVLFLVAVLAGGLDAAPKEKKASVAKAKTIEVKAWDCAGCHKDKKVLPDNHMAIKEMSYDGCLMCHIPGQGKAGTLKGKIPGSHLHALKDVKCAQCHGKVKKPEPVEMSQCVACHGSTAKLAEKTKDVKPNNPHTSPHYGTELDCNLCHHQHAKSENYCAQCHKFDFIVP